MRRAAVFLALVLAACGTPVTSGVVTDKKFEPASTTPLVIPCGKSTCINYVSSGPHWRLLVTDGQASDWIDVDPATWDRAKVGDDYPEVTR